MDLCKKDISFCPGQTAGPFRPYDIAFAISTD
jgi:hypothetical protein